MKFKTNIPVLKVQDDSMQKVYDAAIKNLVEINTIDCSFDVYNKTGIMDLSTPFIIRAGGHYQQPWTRDASLNSMNCASIIEPDVAKNTLLSVCEKDDRGNLRVSYENRNFWDKVIWIIAAYNYYLTNLDEEFLKKAYKISKNTMGYYEKNHYSKEYGLFNGGSFFNDGITGYPLDLHSSESKDGNVSTHKATDEIMCLSTNCIYYMAYIALAEMAKLFDEKFLVDEYKAKADSVKQSINKYMWNSEKGIYSYIFYPDGRVDNSQEGAGNLFAVLFDVCDDERAHTVLENIKTEKYGMPSIYEPFKGFSTVEKPARHNNLIWPHINSFYITAASKMKRTDLLEQELNKITSLFVSSDYNFYEVYNPYDGSIDGGWQLNWHWDSCFDQTWCATGYIAAILYGIFGMRITKNEISFSPCVPDNLADISFTKIVIGKTIIDVSVIGSGNEIEKIVLNDKVVERACIDRCEKHCNLKIYLKKVGTKLC